MDMEPWQNVIKDQGVQAANIMQNHNIILSNRENL